VRLTSAADSSVTFRHTTRFTTASQHCAPTKAAGAGAKAIEYIALDWTGRVRRPDEEGNEEWERNKQMSHIQHYEQSEMDYGADKFQRESEIKMSKRQRASYGRRRGKSPQSVNGIHRRRNRKMSW
jgi:hypothetical protein